MKTTADLAWLEADTSASPAPSILESRALPSLYLHPGQLFVSPRPTEVTTILGSCVAVCLWDAEAGIGGINHFLLPTGVRSASAGLKYGNVAIAQLLEKLALAGATRLRAKLFGGACVLDAMRNRENHLGGKNVEIARSLLAEARIPIIASDVGGDRGRKLIFHPHDGQAVVKLL